MRTILCLLVVLLMTFRAQGQVEFKTGLTEPSKEQLAWAQQNVRSITRRSTHEVLPASHKNITHLPVVGSQGSFGACASWATTYYLKTWQEAKERGWVRPDPASEKRRVANPMFCYSIQSAGTDEGSSLLGNMQFMTRHGVATYLDRPRDRGLELPTEDEWKAAAAWRSSSVSTIQTNTPEGMAALKEHLVSGNLAAVGMYWPKNLAHDYPTDGPGINNGVYYNPQGGAYIPATPSHAVCIIGYDDNRSYIDGTGTAKKGAFLAVNSWGQGWGWTDPDAGSGGFLWIAYDLFSGTECYTMVDRINYVPKNFATVVFSHPMLQELEIYVRGGDRTGPKFSVNATDFIPRQLGKPVFQMPIALDLTDEADFLQCSAYEMVVEDMELPMWPVATGWFYHFSVERQDSPQPWVSTDLSPEKPLETVDIPYSQLGNPNWPNRYLRARVSLLEDEGSIASTPNMLALGNHDLGDYDNDGDLDIAYSTGSSSGSEAAILRNDGPAGFVPSGIEIADVAGQVVWADLNNDGRLDLVLSGWEGSWDFPSSVVVYMNQGANLFIKAPQPIPPFANQLLTLADYDADGDLDIVLADGTVYYSTTNAPVWIFRNDGQGNFSDTGIRLGHSIDGTCFVAWSDFNSDGLQDVAISGIYSVDNAPVQQIALLTNKGNGVFEAMTPIAVDRAGPVGWCDYNSDGLSDLCAYTGYDGVSLTIYRNKGAAGFVQAATGLMSGYFPTMSSWDWGDLDNDGRSDLVVTCETVVGSSQTTRTRAYKNYGNGTFKEMMANLPNVGRGNVQLADLDEDGDVDMSLLGLEWASGTTPVPFTPHFRLFRNRAAQKEGFDRPNEPPSIPAGLTYLASTPSGWSQFRWSDSTDDRAGAKALRYQLRIGTNDDWNDLANSGEMQLPGSWGRSNYSGTLPGISLLPATMGSRPFCWSVRAIDTAGLASAWSETKWERVPSGAAGANDVQRDGAVDVADLVECIRMAKGLLTPDFSRADRNGDGKINLTDEAFISAQILGEQPPERDCLALNDIGPAGGTIESDGFKVEIPSGALKQIAHLRLYKSTIDKPLGANTAAPVFRIRGIPRDASKPITVTIRPDVPLKAGENPMGFFGSLCDGPSLSTPRREFLARPAQVNSNGTATFTIPAIGSATLSRAALGGTYQFGFENEEWYTLGETVGTVIGTYCVVTYPPSPSLPISLVDMKAIAQAFDESWHGFQSTYGLSPSKRTEWPVLIMVKDFGASSNTVAEADFFRCYDGTLFDGVSYKNNGFISCNYRKLGTPDQRKTMAATVTHEAFHLYQDLYDPRVGMLRTKGMSPHHWFYEALSVWSEPKFLTVVANIPSPTTYYSDAWITWGESALKGMIEAAGSDKASQQNHGYGLAPLVGYFADKRGRTTFAKTALEKIEAGKDVMDAICLAGGVPVGQKQQTWWPKFLEQLFLNQIPGFELNVGMFKGWSDKVFEINDTKIDFKKNSMRVSGEMADLSGRLLTTALVEKPSPDPNAVLSHRFKGPQEASLAAITVHGPQHKLVGRGEMNNHVLKIDVPLWGLFTGLKNDFWNVGALAINPRSVSPYLTKSPFVLEAAVTWDQTYSYTASAQDQSQSPYLPRFQINQTLSSPGLTDVDQLSISPYGGYIYGSALGVPPFDVEFASTVTIQDAMAVITHSDGSSDMIYVEEINGFRLEYTDDWLDGVTKQTTNVDGRFTVSMSKDAHYLGGSMYALYKRIKDRYDKEGKLLGTDMEDSWWPVGGFALYPTGLTKEDYLKDPSKFSMAKLDTVGERGVFPSSRDLLAEVAAVVSTESESTPVEPVEERLEKVQATAPGKQEIDQISLNALKATGRRGSTVTLDLRVPLSSSSNGLNGQIDFDPALFSKVVVEPGTGAAGFVIRSRETQEGNLRFLLYDPDGSRSINHKKPVLRLTVHCASDIAQETVAMATFSQDAAARIIASPPGVVSVGRSGPGGVPPAETVQFPDVKIHILTTAAQDWGDYR